MSSGSFNIVASCLDIPLSIHGKVKEALRRFSTGLLFDYGRLYTEFIDGSYHAAIRYRKGLFDLMRNICEQKGVTFALCMEYELKEEGPVGLNREFMSSTSCEGLDVPVYARRNGKFQPAADCNGTCLTCREAKCGIPDLAMDALKDIFLVEKTRTAAQEILEEDPELKKYPLLREKLGKFRERIHLE